jgi:hypothetical protein
MSDTRAVNAESVDAMEDLLEVSQRPYAEHRPLDGFEEMRE